MHGVSSAESPPHAAESTSGDDAPPVRRGRRVARRLFLLFVLLQLPLFFNGCDINSYRFTVGALVPYAEFEVGPDFQFRRLSAVSQLGLPANLLLIAACLLVAARFWPRLWRQLESPLFFASLIVTLWLFLSFWFLPSVWGFVVMMPTIHVANFIRAVVLGDDTTRTATDWPLLIAGRVYFFACLAIVGVVLRGAAWAYRRYVLVAPDRWWQLSLGGALAVMLILGTALGLLLRLLSS